MEWRINRAQGKEGSVCKHGMGGGEVSKEPAPPLFHVFWLQVYNRYWIYDLVQSCQVWYIVTLILS